MSQAKGAALVTGASGGIGEALARLLAADGYDLVLVARDRARLEAVAREVAGAHGIRAHVVPADLTHPHAPEAIHAAVRELGVSVEVLVNNAGFGLYGAFAEVPGEAATELGREMEMIQVNVAALTHLTKLFLPAMVGRGRGRVMNVASTAAFQPGPLMAVYYATKAYVLSFSNAIGVELEGTGVTVTALCPGPTHTRFAAEARMEGSRLFRGGGTMGAAEVARAGFDAMMAGRATVIPGARNKVMAQATRLVPRTFAARLARQAQQKAH
jgi:uncharacterized protein